MGLAEISLNEDMMEMPPLEMDMLSKPNLSRWARRSNVIISEKETTCNRPIGDLQKSGPASNVLVNHISTSDALENTSLPRMSDAMEHHPDPSGAWKDPIAHLDLIEQDVSSEEDDVESLFGKAIYIPIEFAYVVLGGRVMFIGLFIFFIMMNILVWNCQVAASKEFYYVLKDFIQKYKVNILGFLEPRVSRTQVDLVCKGIGFENWVRVQAVGFSGGIWLFWKEWFSVDIVYTYP
ncbi:hypothetical protein PTKIN_Ptkin07bG0237900 [Pterospermum kingtungense]